MINCSQKTNPLTEIKDFFLRDLEFSDEVYGSNTECLQYDQDDIADHNRNLQYAMDRDEYDTLIEAFPEEFPPERFAEYRMGVIVNA